MKIAVYAIAKNEESNVAEWLNSLADADGIFVLDTGSNDKTLSLLETGGATVQQMHGAKTFRFDQARAQALSLVPAEFDVCITLDFDERLAPGWRAIIEEQFTDDIDVANYTLVYAHDAEGNITVSYPRLAIHRRDSAAWQYPVHEILIPIKPVKPVTLPIFCVHYGKPKAAGHYLDLLIMAHSENPNDPRNVQYLAREYYAMQNYGMAVALFKSHLDIETYAPFLSESARRIAEMSNDYETSEWWFRQAVQYCNNTREPYCDLALFYFHHKQYEHCIAYVRSALMVERPTYEMIYTDIYYNGSWCNHMLMACYQQTGNLRAAQEQKDIIISFYPDQTLPKNIQKDIAILDRAVQEALYVYLSSVGVQG